MQDAPELRFPAIVRYEETCICQPGVVFALFIDRAVNGDIVCLALDDDERRFVVCLLLRCPPDHKVGTCLRRSVPSNLQFLGDLLQLEAVIIGQDTKELLSDMFFRRFHKPHLSERAPDDTFSAGNDKPSVVLEALRR